MEHAHKLKKQSVAIAHVFKKKQFAVDSVSLEENKEEIVLKDKNTKNRIGSDSFKEDIYNRYVWFADGKY